MAIELPYRRLAVAAEWLLLALVMLLHAGAWIWSSRLVDLGPAGALLADSVPLASLLVLAAWCALGPGFLWLRGAFAAGLLLVAGVAVASPERFTWSHADALLGLAPLATLLAAAAPRATGLRATLRVPGEQPDRGATFTVRGLLVITTAIALAIGMLEAARPWLRAADNSTVAMELWLTSGARPQPRLTLRAPAAAPFKAINAWLVEAHRKGQFRLALVACLLTVAALIAYTTLLRRGAVWLGLTGLAAIVPAAGWYIGHLTDTSPETSFTLTLWIATIITIVVVSLVPLRLMGYRLVRTKPPLTNEPSPLADLPRFTSDRDHLSTNHTVRAPAEVSS